MWHLKHRGRSFIYYIYIYCWNQNLWQQTYPSHDNLVFIYMFINFPLLGRSGTRPAETRSLALTLRVSGEAKKLARTWLLRAAEFLNGSSGNVDQIVDLIRGKVVDTVFKLCLSAVKMEGLTCNFWPFSERTSLFRKPVCSILRQAQMEGYWSGIWSSNMGY